MRIQKRLSHLVGQARLAAALCALLTAAALLVVACAGDGAAPTPKATEETPRATMSPQTTRTTSPDETPTPTSIPTPTNTNLEELAAQFVEGVDGKVVYEYSSNFGGKPNGTYTVYRRGDNYRQDWHTTLDEVEFTATTIITGDKSYMCTITAINEECVTVEREEAELPLGLFEPITEVPEKIAAGLAGIEAKELPPRKVAGVEASCFDVTVDGRLGEGPDGREELELCFSNEGQFLLMERRVVFDTPGRMEGTLHLEAQSVGDAKNDDFEPPAPVTR